MAANLGKTIKDNGLILTLMSELSQDSKIWFGETNIGSRKRALVGPPFHAEPGQEATGSTRTSVPVKSPRILVESEATLTLAPDAKGSLGPAATSAPSRHESAAEAVAPPRPPIPQS